MKRLLIATLLGFIAAGNVQAAAEQSHNEVTTVGFFFDIPTNDQDRATTLDLVTTIADGCHHIFVATEVFSAMLEHDLIDTQLLLDLYDVYDANDTIYDTIYLCSKDAHETKQFIATEGWMRHLTSPADFTFEPVRECRTFYMGGFWIESLVHKNADDIFDVHGWRKYHAQSNRKVMAYVSGFGKKTTRIYQLKKLLKMLYVRVKATICGIKCDDWTANNLRAEVKRTPRLVTPINKPAPIAVATHLIQQGVPSFFNCVRAMTKVWQGDVTPEVTQYLDQCDTIQLMGDGQKPQIAHNRLVIVPC